MIGMLLSAFAVHRAGALRATHALPSSRSFDWLGSAMGAGNKTPRVARSLSLDSSFRPSFDVSMFPGQQQQQQGNPSEHSRQSGRPSSVSFDAASLRFHSPEPMEGVTKSDGGTTLEHDVHRTPEKPPRPPRPPPSAPAPGDRLATRRSFGSPLQVQSHHKRNIDRDDSECGSPKKIHAAKSMLLTEAEEKPIKPWRGGANMARRRAEAAKGIRLKKKMIPTENLRVQSPRESIKIHDLHSNFV